jgi:hypothetical protein
VCKRSNLTDVHGGLCIGEISGVTEVTTGARIYLFITYWQQLELVLLPKKEEETSTST